MNSHLSGTPKNPRNLSQTLLMGLGGSLACHAAVIAALGYWLPAAPIDELADKEITPIERVNLDPQPVPKPSVPPKAITPPATVPKSPPIKIAPPIKVSTPNSTPVKITPPIIANKSTPVKITPSIVASKPRSKPARASNPKSAPTKITPAITASKPPQPNIEPPSLPPSFPDRLFDEPTPATNQKPTAPPRQRREPKPVKIVRRTTDATPTTVPLPTPQPTTDNSQQQPQQERNPNPSPSPTIASQPTPTPSTIAPTVTPTPQVPPLVGGGDRLPLGTAFPQENLLPKPTAATTPDPKLNADRIPPPANDSARQTLGDRQSNLPPPTINARQSKDKSGTADRERAKPPVNTGLGDRADSPQKTLRERATSPGASGKNGNSPTPNSPPGNTSNSATASGKTGNDRSSTSRNGGEEKSPGSGSGGSNSKSNSSSNAANPSSGIQCLHDWAINYRSTSPNVQALKDKIIVRARIEVNGTITQAEIYRSSENPERDAFVLASIKQVRCKSSGKVEIIKINFEKL